MTAAFSSNDFDALDGWLREGTTGIVDIVTLEGFLTAVAIGPNTLSPMTWLPKVWGSRQPRFKDAEELDRFVTLVMGLYNEIVGCFIEDPEGFEPSFFEHEVNGQQIVIVDEWCAGSLKGVRLDPAGWKPLTKERGDLMKPIRLFGTRAGWRACRTAEWAS